MDSNLKREIIMDNYKEPFNKGLVEDSSYETVNTNSESCIDNLDFMVKIENDIIKDIRFDGEACAISTSAASIMIQTLIGKKIDEVRNILNNYISMINEETYDEDLIGELIVYDDIAKQPSRKNCAMLPSTAVLKILDKLKK